MLHKSELMTQFNNNLALTLSKEYAETVFDVPPRTPLEMKSVDKDVQHMSLSIYNSVNANNLAYLDWLLKGKST